MSALELEHNIIGNSQILVPDMMMDQYLVEGSLATTKLSQVYRGTNFETGEPVAIKVPLTEEGEQMLDREAVIHQALGGLPGIVQFDGNGEVYGRPYVATLLQEGGTLAREMYKDKTHMGALAEKIEDEIGDTTEAIDSFELKANVTALDDQGLPKELAERDLHEEDTELVVQVVADAAQEIGRNLTPESIMTKKTAQELLKRAVERSLAVLTEEDTRLRAGILLGVATGLQVLHNRIIPITNGDIKPFNVGVNMAAEGSILDFGLAVEGETILAQPRGSVAAGNIPPEGFLGKVSPATDMFGFSATGYEALTGEKPWPQTMNPQVAYDRMHQSRPKEPIELNPHIPQDVNDAIMAGLSWNPSARWDATDTRNVYQAAA